MDEYFCPNCNAILSYQYGFNPELGVWKCTKCGETLMDDNVYDGETFKGVAWICDGCGALLNKQLGFSDSYGSWSCTECGYFNRISKDDIVEDFEEQHIIKCPKCNANLKAQTFFKEYLDDYECTSCGVVLHRDYSCNPYIVMNDAENPRCPKCKELLKEQYSYSDYYDDYECSSCGAMLHRDYSDEPYIVMNDTENPRCPKCKELLNDQACYSDCLEDYVCASCGTKLHRNCSDEPYEVLEQEEIYEQPKYIYQKEYESRSESPCSRAYIDRQKQPTEEKNEKRKVFCKKHWKGILILSISLILIIAIWMLILYLKSLITVENDADDLEGIYFEEAASLLEEAGFTRITCKPLDDLSINEVSEEYLVDKVIISGDTDFDDDSRYPYNAKVVIEYHTIKAILLSFSHKDVKGEYYQDVIEKFEQEGFVNIKTEVIYDLITGWITNDGEIESVTIGGDEKYGKGTEYRPDVEIIITYHTYKKNKK